MGITMEITMEIVRVTTVLNNSMVNDGDCMGNYGDFDNLA